MFCQLAVGEAEMVGDTRKPPVHGNVVRSGQRLPVPLLFTSVSDDAPQLTSRPAVGDSLGSLIA
jgi:hypothetical protein